MTKKSGYIFVLLILASCSSSGQEQKIKTGNTEHMYYIQKSDEEWKSELTDDEYRVLIQCGTELPGTGKYNNFYKKGKYYCAACGQLLFDSGTKYSSGSGWPSFFDVISDSSVVLIEDRSHGMVRTEVRCSDCGGHLGHVFNDGPEPTGLRYCINSVSMKFVEEEEANNKDK